ncbi:MAG TPA: DUF3137 domain-containing protein [Actinomycetota bacterium]|jgi:hypothetical protein
MPTSTSYRILGGIAAGIAAFALIMVLTGDEGSRDLFRGAFVLLVIVGGMWWLVYRFRILPRRESFAGQAQALGLHAEEGDPQGVGRQGFALFRWSASAGDIENTAQGVRGGIDITIADHWFVPSGLTRREAERSTCVLTPAPAGWPDLSVVPERLAARLRSTFALPDVRTESDAFNRRFEVRSDDRRFALALLDARMMEWLLEQLPGIGFEVLGGTLMVFRPRTSASYDDLGKAVELLERLLEQVPRVTRAEHG